MYFITFIFSLNRKQVPIEGPLLFDRSFNSVKQKLVSIHSELFSDGVGAFKGVFSSSWKERYHESERNSFSI